jgi:hypothetical protein
LEALPGWTWNAYADQWEEHFKSLQEFEAREGHCNVPKTYRSTDGSNLGQWVANQRRNETKMESERKRKLEALSSWVWDLLYERWLAGFNQLQEFAAREGHCRVPALFSSAGGYCLGAWVANQRSKRNVLPQDKKTMLESLPGWVWQIRGRDNEA